MQTVTQSVAFTQMKDGTQAEYAFLQTLEHAYIRELPERLLTALQRLGDGLQGYQISRLEHSLQSATRAEADGADVDMVVAALLHDIGDDLAPENHSAVRCQHPSPLCAARCVLGGGKAWAVPDAVLRPPLRP